MKFLEQDLEDLIYEASQTQEGRQKLEERGLWIRSPLKRQVSLGSYGVLDLLDIYGEHDQCLNVTIYELKKGELNAEHMMQLCRYLTAIKRHLKSIELEMFKRVYVRGRLVGRSIKSSDDFCFLVNETGRDIRTYTYSFDMDNGLMFSESYGWKNTDENLSDIGHLLNGISTPIDVDYFEFLMYRKEQENEQKKIS